MGPAPLPACPRKRRGDRVDQTGMGVGDHQAHAGETSDHETPQERGPAGSVLGRVHVKAQDLPGALRVHAGRDDHRHVHDPSALAHLLGERVQPHVGVRAGLERAGAEGLDGSQLLCHLRDPGLGDPLDPELANQALDPAGGDAADVALGHDLDEGALGPTALRDLKRDRARPCVPRTLPVAVAPVDPFLGALTVVRAAQGIDLGSHQPLGEDLHHLPQQIDIGSVYLLAEGLQRVNSVPDHRAPPPRVPLDLVEDDAVVFLFNDLQSAARTPLRGTLLLKVWG